MSSNKIEKLPRFLEKTIQEVSEISPCVFIAGARQIGKSTLAMKLVSNYVLLDDIGIRESIEGNTIAFVQTQNKPVFFLMKFRKRLLC